MGFKTAKDIEEHCKKWRQDSVEFFNENIAGKSQLDQQVLLTRVKSLEQDMKQALAYIEILARLLPQPEEDNK